jgi:hypothetical protein
MREFLSRWIVAGNLRGGLTRVESRIIDVLFWIIGPRGPDVWYAEVDLTK